jgi:hypothetical protein
MVTRIIESPITFFTRSINGSGGTFCPCSHHLVCAFLGFAQLGT